MLPLEVSLLGLALGGTESCPRLGVGDRFLLPTETERSEDILVFFLGLCLDGKKVFE